MGVVASASLVVSNASVPANAYVSERAASASSQDCGLGVVDNDGTIIWFLPNGQSVFTNGTNSFGWYSTQVRQGAEDPVPGAFCMYAVGSQTINIGALDTILWQLTVNDAQMQFGCYWRSSTDVSVSYGWQSAEYDNSQTDGATYDMSSTTATNWALDGEGWAAGAVFWLYETSSWDQPLASQDMVAPSNTSGGTTCGASGAPTIDLSASPQSGYPTVHPTDRASFTPQSAGQLQTMQVVGPADESQVASCPTGYDLVHAEAFHLSSTARDAAVAGDPRVSGDRAQTVPQAGTPGETVLQIACSPAGAAIHGARSMIFGSASHDRFTNALEGVSTLGGKGPDTLHVGLRAAGFGGSGRDTLIVKGAGGSALGGSGRDFIRAVTTGRSLINGGYGEDVLQGALGPTRINSQDGQHDTVVCLSRSNIVLADSIDTLIGPCTRIS